MITKLHFMSENWHVNCTNAGVYGNKRM